MVTEYQRIDITLPKELLKKFKAFCKAQGMKPSPRIAVLLRDDLEAQGAALKPRRCQSRSRN
jgi:metal-responsive CopG/Arc/MetJ family transcriptional regulator